MTATTITDDPDFFTWVRFDGFVLGVYRRRTTATESHMSIRFARSFQGLGLARSIELGVLRSNPPADEGFDPIWLGVSINTSALEIVRSKLHELGGRPKDAEQFLRLVRNLIYLVEHVERMSIDLDEIMTDLWGLSGVNFQHCR